MSDIISGYNKQEPFRFWCQTVLPSVYDDSLSYYELLNKVVAYLNEMGDNVSALHDALAEYKAWWDNLDIDVAEEVDKRISEDLEPTVKRQLDIMAEDGTLSALINQDLFVSMNNRINKNTIDISALSMTSIQEDETNCISLPMLKQDVLEAMTGGSVPVVGTNSIRTENIQNSAVTYGKLAAGARTSYILYGKVIVDKELKQITFKTSDTFLAVTSNRVFNLRRDIGGTDTIKTWDGIVGENIWGYVSFNYTGSVPDFYISTSWNETDKYYIGYLINGTFISTVPREQFTIEYANETVPNKTLGVPVEARGARIICDFVAGKIKMPRANNMYVHIAGNYKQINTTAPAEEGYQDDITMSQTFGCLVYNLTTNTMSGVASSSNIAENYVVLGFWYKTRNICSFDIPYSVISDSSNWYNTSPEIPIIGDSIVAGAGASNNRCFEYVCEQLYGIRLLNYGMSGTGYAYNNSGTHRVGDGTVNVAPTGVLPENNTFLDNVQRLINNDTLGDVVIFFGGSNDWSRGMNINEQPAVSGIIPADPLDPESEDRYVNIPYSATYKTKVTNTFKACLEAGARVGVILPIRRGYKNADYVLPTSTIKYYAENTAQGHSGEVIVTKVTTVLKDYVDIIAEVCEELGLPCLDLYNSCVNPNIMALQEKYFDDTAHPNSAGYEQLAITIGDFAKKWFCNPYSVNQ